MKASIKTNFNLAKITLCVTLALSTSAYATAEQSKEAATTQSSYSPYANTSYPKNVFFGDTHLHTSNSVDAAILGNFNIGPREAYQFAKGDPVKAHNGMTAQMNKALDFLVIADHAAYQGLVPLLRNGDPDVLNNKQGKLWGDMLKEGGKTVIIAAYQMLTGKEKLINDPKLEQSVWDRNIAAADEYNEPGKFTAMIGFEWTSMPGGDNLHRVVIFKDDAGKASQVVPYSNLDSENPEDLWKYMADYETETGGEILAIAHNGNVSNGQMFLDKDMDGKPLSADYAQRRARWEPLYEVTQMKGDGETHPLLSPNDEFADFESWDKGNIQSFPKKEGMHQFEYAREALKNGLQFEADLGTNPFKFGMIGSTDAHTGLASAKENNQWGKLSNKEPSEHRRVAELVPSRPGVEGAKPMIGYTQSASGYAAVWATENTREALFAAMKRKETYATTGPRMSVRFFGGWNYQENDAFDPDYVKIGYQNGVPMGGDLTNAPKGKAPSFIVSAAKDPDGANLDRVQVVKGWVDANGKTQEKVFDVALADDRKPGARASSIGSTVDVNNASYTNTIGDALLATVWTDPEFDAEQKSFYYVRVIEIPTPRWTAFDKKYFGGEMPKEAVMVLQERAYTSPIWYTPGE